MAMMNEDVWPASGERVLCAVSGGLDSMCLLHMLAQRCGAGNVTAAHFNHRLRKTADRDEAFVRDYCAARGIPFVRDEGDVARAAKEEGLSPEEAGRKLRYAFLRRAAAERGGIPVYTAHHADDNAETILLNLVRGTGIAGLAGMEHAANGLRRPLLNKTRAELAAYAAAHRIPHVEDETNADPDAAARNLLRLRVMPLLRELNPRAAEHMNQTAGQLRDIDRFLEEEAARRIACAQMGSGGVSLPGNALREAPAAVRPRMLLRLFDLLGVGRKDIGAAHLEALAGLADKRAGQLDLPYGVTARYEGDCLLLARSGQLPEQRLLPGVPLHWGGYTLTLLDRREREGLALRSGAEAVTAAPCRGGERLTLPGASGARTVKRLCLDRHISPAEREGLPAIFLDGRLAAVWPLGMDVEFLPEGEACRFIQIIKETEENHHEK